MLEDQIILQMPPDLQMTDEEFFEFCQTWVCFKDEQSLVNGREINYA
ncbi:MAG: hypothetical protein F6K17_09050 [Okeania sp. SIO3C4]|nr:hypothetical protein [Okeania sp. SIO3C4]